MVKFLLLWIKTITSSEQWNGVYINFIQAHHKVQTNQLQLPDCPNQLLPTTAASLNSQTFMKTKIKDGENAQFMPRKLWNLNQYIYLKYL